MNWVWLLVTAGLAVWCFSLQDQLADLRTDHYQLQVDHKVTEIELGSVKRRLFIP